MPSVRLAKPLEVPVMRFNIKEHKRAVIIFAAALALVIGFSLFFILRYTERVDYIDDDGILSGDFSRYVTVDKSVYDGAVVNIKISPVGEVDIEERVMLDLVGLRTSDNPKFTRAGEIGVGDKLIITSYKVESEGGEILAEQSGVGIEHFVGETFKIYGYELSGMQVALVGLTVGEQIIYARLPYSYHDAALACERVKITLNIDKFIDYTVPDVDDELISEKLKLDEELAALAGDTLTEKYYTYIKNELEREYAEAVKALGEEAVWRMLTENASIKRLPRADVRDKYHAYYAEIEEIYTAYAASVMSFEDFGAAYVGLSDGESLDDYLMREAELSVADKLTFYYVISTEGWIPDSSALAELYSAVVEEYLAVYVANDLTCRPEYFKNSADYDKKVAEHRQKLLEDFGEDYFYDVVYSEYGMAKLVEAVKIVNVLE